MAACLCAQEVMWLRRLMEELGAKQVAPTTVYEDNDGCIALSKNPRNKGRTKHIAIKWHYVRDCVKSKDMDLIAIDTGKNLADILTKSVARIVFQRLVENAMHNGK